MAKKAQVDCRDRVSGGCLNSKEQDLNWFSDLFSLDMIKNVLIIAIPALICITVHELAHGFTAYKLGDNTAKEMGRLTLNPIRHIDIIGLLMIIAVGFGWAKPVPVNMDNFKHPKAYMAVTSLAGPLSNLILAVIVLLIFMLIPEPSGGITGLWHIIQGDASVLTSMIFRLAMINIALAFFNLIPIPPLDGSKVLFSLLPEKQYYFLMRYERYGMILLVMLILSGILFDFDIFGVIITRPVIVTLNGIIEFWHGIIPV
ncbi:MAG: site-2 protease family protein [Oscillospiraceae bacterium]|nr:site-2 protease family protein [Oscillospiraceae bacterium]